MRKDKADLVSVPISLPGSSLDFLRMAFGRVGGAHGDQLIDPLIHLQVPRKSDIPAVEGSMDGIRTDAGRH